MRFRIMSIAAIIMACLSGTAQAGLLPVAATVQTDGNNHRYTYGVVLTSDSTLRTGDFFTVYDFSGFIEGSNVQPEGFTFSSSATGSTPSGVVPTDTATQNLTWTYTGTETLTGQIGLGNFSAISTNAASDSSTAFAATTHRSDGQVDSNITETTAPSEVGPAAGVPEPASLALVGIGLPLAGFFYRRRSGSACLAI